ESNGVQLKKVNYTNGNGVDNQAFEIEEDNITDTNSVKGRTEKTKKGLGLYLRYILDLTYNLSCTSAKFPSRLTPQRITSRLTQKPSNTLCWAFLEQAMWHTSLQPVYWTSREPAIALVVLTSLAVVAKSYELVKEYKGESISRCFRPAVRCFKANLKWIKWVFIVAVVALLVAWLVLDTIQRPEQLISFGGVCMFVVLIFLFSAHRTEIFLDYTKEGSSFVFGDLIANIFAFQALPIVVFFSSVMSVLYYLGVMQWLILKISWVMQITMGTSPTETLSVAGNIFVGQTEAPLLIRPYLNDMTKSEIHAVLTGGFSTIAGSVMGAFISFGIDAASLISASVMAAPCALAISKLSYPETEESPHKSEKNVKVSCGDEQNILEAASSGASASIGLVANIAANLIAFLAILGFINQALSWLGGMVGYPQITFQMICSYVFMPIAFMMGVPYKDSFTVAQLIGTKLFLNEFVAYETLSELKQNRLNGLDEFIGDKKNWISVRSEIITTYALCGFANFSSLGIVIGGLSSICPPRRGDISSMVLRAMLTGTCVSLINACIAGLLFVPPLDCVGLFKASTFNATDGNIQTCCRDLLESAVNNGTISFEGSWNTVVNVTTYFSKCCECCGLSALVCK
ncbi:hypothetical protein L3Q82_023937, partial [Scortum barcoo]